MLFNSLEFLLFFPITILLYFLLPHRSRWLLLLIASCVFYASFIPAYLLILFFTIVVDYFAGIFIEDATGKSKKRFLIMSIIANVGVLAVFKYYNFFIDNVNDLLHIAGIKTYDLPFLKILLPIGLSFHTFQAMSYTIEVYRKKQAAEKHFGIYALYVMFFPQLVAGPIERPQNLLHQFREKHSFSSQNLIDGLRLMCWGLFKKVVIADRLAIYVNAVYDHPSQYHYLNLIIATIFLAIQIYCDFSGYSDIAIGSAKVMGFDLMTNFNRPYFSTSIAEFWKRWHISLSTWLRDYLFMPIAVEKRDWGKWAIVYASMITFLICGFWHGANWNFIIFGGLHGVYLSVPIIFKKTRNKINQFLGIEKLPRINYFFQILITFSLWCFSLIFFRSVNLSEAFLVIKNIFSASQSHSFLLFLENANSPVDFGLTSIFIVLLMIIYMFLIEIFYTPGFKELNNTYKTDIAFMALTLSLTIGLGVFNETSFIYFQF